MKGGIFIFKNLNEIQGFQNCSDYIIYDDGRLYSKKTSKFLKPLKDTKGYFYYDLRYAGAKYKCPKVHRLVMLAFSEDIRSEQINHIDGDKSNNHISNLEWCTNRENRTHALQNGLKNEIGYNIAQYDLDGNLLNIFSTAREALEFLGKNNDRSGNIGRAIRGSRKTAYGYIWKQCEGSTTIPLSGSTLK